MTPFEEQLKKALAREEPSAGFTERVLAQVSESKRVPNRWIHWRLAMAAAVAFLVVGGVAYQQYEHQVQGENAKRKLMLALHIAGSKLQETQERVNQVENSEVSQ